MLVLRETTAVTGQKYHEAKCDEHYSLTNEQLTKNQKFQKELHVTDICINFVRKNSITLMMPQISFIKYDTLGVTGLMMVIQCR